MYLPHQPQSNARNGWRDFHYVVDKAHRNRADTESELRTVHNSSINYQMTRYSIAPRFNRA
jgi:hypothetical protein